MVAHISIMSIGEEYERNFTMGLLTIILVNSSAFSMPKIPQWPGVHINLRFSLDLDIRLPILNDWVQGIKVVLDNFKSAE